MESDAQTALGISVIVFILTFIVFFEIGLGSIPWQIGGEIFPDGPRATAMSKNIRRAGRTFLTRYFFVFFVLHRSCCWVELG